MRKLPKIVNEADTLLALVIAIVVGVLGLTSVASDSVIYEFDDAAAFLRKQPDVSLLIARLLAQRLNVATTYLADLKNQYGDAPGLAMVSEVLNHLAHRQGPAARAGSAREPNPDY